MSQLMDEEDIRRIVQRLSHEILEKNKGTKDLVIIGIQRRGVNLAGRISKMMDEIEGEALPTGILDITLYRDDLTQIAH
ncbi:bifunctional pyr operon transcriptional regulator/uracil phosphoribosyltransferase, partial [Candidatus Aerophobetes bacterium]